LLMPRGAAARRTPPVRPRPPAERACIGVAGPRLSSWKQQSAGDTNDRPGGSNQ
jgi:hypothetical protein